MTMDINPLESLVQRLKLLDAERADIARHAFSALSTSDRELWELSIDAFQKEESAAHWFAGTIPVLGGKMPLDLLLHGRREEVMDCLYRIKYSIFS